LRSFGGDESLLAETVGRAGFADEAYVLTRPSLADDVRDHAPNAGVLTEPEPEDTGPALAYAAHRIREQVGDCAMVVLPSDHHVEGDFAATMERAAAVAVETDGLVSIGVEPTRPETGYGYVKPGEDRETTDGHAYAPVERFTEKPDQGAAMRYRHHGYYWNAGMFAWTPDAFLRDEDEPGTNPESNVETGTAGA
jgi:mannose-1-phosphate guanylyltransferase